MNKQEAIEEIKNIGTLNIYDKVAGRQVTLMQSTGMFNNSTPEKENYYGCLR